MGRVETWYRGFNSKYGLRSQYAPHLLWLTDDIDYAKEYGDSLAVFEIDFDKCNGSVYDLDEWTDYYDGPNEEEARELLSQGINSYCFYANDDSSYCMCLWSDEPIISQRILDNNEINENKNMKKNVVKLNESTLRQIVAESVKKVLKEWEKPSDWKETEFQGTYTDDDGSLYMPDDDYKDYEVEQCVNELKPLILKVSRSYTTEQIEAALEKILRSGV